MRKVVKKVEENKTGTSVNRSEYNAIFNSFMNLQHSNDDYSKLVANAMEATDNIMAMKGVSPQISPTKVGGQNVQSRLNSRETAKEQSIELIFNALDKFA